MLYGMLDNLSSLCEYQIQQRETEMLKPIKLWTRRMGDQPWEFYGEITSQEQYQREMAHIRALGLAVKRG